MSDRCRSDLDSFGKRASVSLVAVRDHTVACTCISRSVCLHGRGCLAYESTSQTQCVYVEEDMPSEDMPSGSGNRYYNGFHATDESLAF